MIEPAINNLLKRLDRVERENRWLKLIGAFTVVGLSALLFMGQAKPSNVARTIDAEKFVVRDANGQIGAVLGITGDGNLGLEIRDKNGKAGLVLGIGLNGNPALRMDSKEGKSGLALGVRSDNNPGVELYDRDGKVVWVAPSP
jgi:hypothetical protein